jgi:hypothetical protein
LIASSRFSGIGSAAMMRPAPAILAALIVARPTPPQPITATVSPGVTLQALKIVPAPVVTAQPMTAARSSGISGLIATQACSWTSICSARPADCIWSTTLPSLERVRRGASPGGGGYRRQGIATCGR